VDCRIIRQYFDPLTMPQLVPTVDSRRHRLRNAPNRGLSLKTRAKERSRFIQKLEANERIWDLPSSPLLLTLLLLVFQGRNDFGGTKAELYREGVEIPLRKWDARRGIERDRPYGLSISDMETLLTDVAYRRLLGWAAAPH
jgi:predicted NACHT family NTPase